MRIIASSFFLLLLVALVSWSDARKTFVPSGTVRVSDTLYYDRFEVTNLQWSEYERWNRECFGIESEEYKRALNDTTILPKYPTEYNEPSMRNYSWHPAFDDFPVLGVSYEQAVAFCKWRTEREYEAIAKKKRGAGYPVELHYRLPTEQEWSAVAGMEMGEKKRKPDNYWERAGMFWHYHLIPDTSIYKQDNEERYVTEVEYSEMTAPVESFYPNTLGIYHLIGNVREMTSIKGIAKGGGFLDRESDVTLETVFPYEDFPAEPNYDYQEPFRSLGFRCVCVVKR